MKRLFFDVFLMIGLASSICLNIFQFYAIDLLTESFDRQCGSSIITIRESELNKMFDKLEEGSEK
jgi:hypothetical protein